MSFYSFLNTNNFTLPNFWLNFNNWALPSFNWQNNFSLNNSFILGNNFTSTIGDTYTKSNLNYSYNQTNFNSSYTPTVSQNITYTLPTASSPPPLTFSTKTYNNNFSDESNSDFLRNYNANKGKKLATTALNNSVGWSGYCAKYVKTAIKDSGLGSYTSGHAYQMKEILNNNPNFKQISTDNIDVKDLPAGCVLVYDRGAQGYSSSYGHVEITTGDGRAVSDGITNNLRKPSAVFIPV